MSHAGVVQGVSCRGGVGQTGVGCVMQGWAVVNHAGVGWVIQGWVMQGHSESYRDSMRGHTGVG